MLKFLKTLINSTFRAKPWDAFFNKISPTDICIDCGANVGNVTSIFAKNGAQVYAFEPNPYAFDVLKKRFANQPNVKCYNQGVFDKQDALKLYLHEHSDDDEVKWSVGSSLISSKSNVRKDKFVEVEVIDLAKFIEELDKPVKVLKLDVEGVEIEILDALIDKNLHEKIEMIFVETHDHKMPELKTKTDQLRQRIKKEQIKNINLDWI